VVVVVGGGGGVGGRWCYTCDRNAGMEKDRASGGAGLQRLLDAMLHVMQ
jgi:hypothetical protein